MVCNFLSAETTRSDHAMRIMSPSPQTRHGSTTATPIGSKSAALRVTTVSRKREDGRQSTETLVEQRNPGQPSDQPRLTEQTIDIVRPGLDGSTRQTQTLRSPDSSGGLGVVSVDTRSQAASPVIKIDIAPSKPGQASPAH